jgi:DNA polymerase/3'-5' exonuclease PolX
MKLTAARDIANHWLEVFKPYTKRIEIAGSIRREKDEVKDIELVVIPDSYHLELFIRDQRLHLKKNGPKYKQIYFACDCINLDMFICTPETFAMNKLIRCGSADYCKGFMIDLHRRGFTSKDARLYRYDVAMKEPVGAPLPVMEEADVYKITGIPWIEPKERR